MTKKIIKNAVSKNGNTLKALSEKITGEIDGGSRIMNATLVVSNVRGADFEVRLGNESGEIIDYITAPEDDKISVDITAEIGAMIKNGSEQAAIWSGGGFNENFNAATDAELIVEYISERVMHESGAYCDVSAGAAGSGKINLASGCLSFIHDDGAASGISHVYNTWQAGKTTAEFDLADGKSPADEYGCGKGWKLNLHQYLLKRAASGAEDKYTYVDGEGNYHEFSERYYYEAGGAKHFVRKEAVNIDFDGKLTFFDGTDEHEIKTRLSSTGGLTLHTDMRGFAGADKIELRSEERARLEEEIESLRRVKSDCEYTVAECGRNGSAEYRSLLMQQRLLEADAVGLERRSAEAYRLIAEPTETILNKKAALDDCLRKDGEGKYMTYPGSGCDGAAAGYRQAQEAYEAALEKYDEAAAAAEDARIAALDGADPMREALLRKEEKYALLRKAQRDLTGAQKALTEAQETFGKEADLLQQTVREESNRIEAANWRETKTAGAQLTALAEAREEYIRAKNKFDDEREKIGSERNDELYERAVTDLENADKLLQAKEFRLRTLAEREPVRFLSDDTGMVLAFNEEGRLAAIADEYDNVASIIYENGKISAVTDGKRETKLVYDGGLLAKIIDPEERAIGFGYSDDGYLVRITYPDGTMSEFSYRDDMPESAIAPSGQGVRFVYNAHRQVSEVREITRVFEITCEGRRDSDGEESRLSARLEYAGMSTTLTDRHGAGRTYIFDAAGKPVTVYDGRYEDLGENTRSLSIDYRGSKRSYVISDNISADNLLSGVVPSGDLSGTPADERKLVWSLDAASIPAGSADFVFSAWAKADSAHICSERITGYGDLVAEERDHIYDEGKRKRKFGLEAELSYGDGTKKSFSACFDWLNTDWQYLALPVTIDEEDATGDRLTASLPFVSGGENRKLTGIKLTLDYSYNTNGIQADCVVLREGSWTYAEFDEDGRAVYGEDDEGNKMEYVYDNRGNIVKTVLTDKRYREFVTTCEYDKRNKPVRTTDHNGLVKETVYDDEGREIRTVAYDLSDPTSKIYEESVRDEQGRIIADRDITGRFNRAEYGYALSGETEIITDADGSSTAFGYRNGALVAVSGSADGEENAVTLTDTLGFITKTGSSGGTEFTYTYDRWGNRKEIRISGERYSETEYTEAVNDGTSTVRTVYGNGETLETTADNKGRIVARKRNGKTIAEINYDDETSLPITAMDKSGEKGYNITYGYDKKGRLVSVRQTESAAEGAECVIERATEYGDGGKVKRNTYVINETELAYDYGYEETPEGRLRKAVLPCGTEQSVELDGLRRVKEIRTGKLTGSIRYAKYGDHATNYVSSVRYGTDGAAGEDVRYTYDRKGNITGIRTDGKEAVTYGYDALDRLVREDNLLLGKVQTFEYDGDGNILAKTVNGERTAYAYAQSGWRDRLVGYGEERIGEYDALGNPCLYRGARLEWRGRDLVSYGENIGYTYNADGMRTKKRIGGLETSYYLDGSKIICEERRENGILTDVMYYYYGMDGIAGFSHNGTAYLYRKSIQGDVTHVYEKDLQGVLTLKVQYVYDAWGNTSVTPESSLSIAVLNPFRYRGYYCDGQTGDSGLYYLQSRYYDPQVGRFINADDIGYIDPKTVNGLNLFTYCGNNPVMNVDFDGNAFFSFLIASIIIGALIGGTMNGVSAYNDGQRG